ncbi:hypothetical protein HYH02_012008 [Chlamydomonas schloesseri]|uniref:Tetratricopeptide repeat protein 1 n=1 Tax=Chlamydomonas schloesseri TaxID=2026947 RepID=A0A835W0R9_9CHLO|nr:hypothetical protein HYH02_012008 [Chlamydomonas schloesseri]|eukprot:KAG2435010.1 hypothetical protein HYH02_012008 [Chlamydomonas schloesseri]
MTDMDAPGHPACRAAADGSAPEVLPSASVAEHGNDTSQIVAVSHGQGDATAGIEPSPELAAADAPPPAASSSAGAGQQDQSAAGEAGTDAEAEAKEVKETETEEEVAARLARAEEFKREGNELFGAGQWEAASVKYNQALDEAPASATKQRAIYFANLAACNIKAGQFAAAVQSCSEALALDGGYEKALMRRCEAFEKLDELDHALGDAKKLAELAPGNAWAKAKVAALQPVVDERTEKLKTEMLGKLKDLGNTILGKFGLSTDNFKFDKDPNTGSYSIRFER